MSNCTSSLICYLGFENNNNKNYLLNFVIFFSDECDVQKLIMEYVNDLECNKPYSFTNEETEDFGVGWQRIVVR